MFYCICLGCVLRTAFRSFCFSGLMGLLPGSVEGEAMWHRNWGNLPVWQDRKAHKEPFLRTPSMNVILSECSLERRRDFILCCRCCWALIASLSTGSWANGKSGESFQYLGRSVQGGAESLRRTEAGGAGAKPWRSQSCSGRWVKLLCIMIYFRLLRMSGWCLSICMLWVFIYSWRDSWLSKTW